MNKTKIEYLDVSWNPIAMRCTPVSIGCAHCWHLAMANRLAANQAFPPEVRDAYAGEGPPVLIKYRLDEPLRRKKPAMIGVQYMGDLFNEDVPFELVHQVFDVVQGAAQHTFQILTKRPKRMLDFLNICRDWPGRDWPYSNVYLGVSVENQATADERHEYLRQCPAAVRFVSYEPALGPVDWTGWEFVSQIISGGESGPGARPSHPDWHRTTRDFCQANGIAYFFKSWGAWSPDYVASKWSGIGAPPTTIRLVHSGGPFAADDCWTARVGKRAAGRLLDGRMWDEFPGRSEQ